MSDTTVIAGAGLAGLITACLVPNAEIFEAGPPHEEQHKALLRFRDESVSQATGIPFKEVRVHKSIWLNGVHYASCNPSFANAYAKKVTGVYAGERSIWNLDPVTRYIAPENFWEQLCLMHYQRIAWNSPLGPLPFGRTGRKVISTIPLPRMMELCGGLKEALANTPLGTMDMVPAPIDVRRYRLPQGSNVYQTVYFPDFNTRLFRASITGDLLIVESMANHAPSKDIFCLASDRDDLSDVLEAFGMDHEDVVEIERSSQRYGKIVDIPRQQREAILYELTRDYNVFSVGRFATWRNILLDDVVNDISIVKRLIEASAYGRDLVLASR